MCGKLASFVLVLGLAGIASADLVAHWDLEEGSGGATTAAVGSPDADGTLVGASWLTADLAPIPGNAAYVFFESLSADRIETNYVGILGQAARSVAAWIKAETTQNNNAVIVSWGPNNPTERYSFRLNAGAANGSQWALRLEIQGSYAIAQTPLNDGQWHHVAVTHDDGATIDQASFYVDGQPEGSLSGTSGGGIMNTGSTSVVLGNSGHSTAGYGLDGAIDDVRMYDHVLTEAEIQQVMAGTPPGLASNASPADGATDVPRDVVLNWMPGEYTGQHDVYFGTSFDDVNNATNLDPMGPDKVYRARQGANSYVAPETLHFGQTYYWRIDEVNAPPTSHVVFKGDVWSFTVEPVAYPIENITATASSSFDASVGPENTINGSGLDDDDLHSVEQTDVWLTGMTAQPPIWIQYEFDKVYKLHEMRVWNFNQVFEPIVGFGLKDVTIEYSADGTDWTQLTGVPEFAKAPGTPGYAHNTTVDFAGAAAKHVRITANDNWGFLTQYGLSEVRFFYTPVWAREPEPASGATGLNLDVTLGFRAGREAARHDVYLGTDEQAVIDGTAPVTAVSQASHGPLSLDLGNTYYWRVDEVNEAETPTTWLGDIWDFATQEYFVVEDFEAYDDYEPNRVFDTWVDGWGVATNGSTIGYPDPVFLLGEHFVETTIVNSGDQSTPLFYDNIAGVTYSEAELTLSPPQDWTTHGVNALSLWFYGDPNNTAQQVYVKVNGSKVVYDGDPDDIRQPSWQEWNIDLSSLVGISLANVNRIAVGVDGAGSGVVYLDDIRLYPSRCVPSLVKPAADLDDDCKVDYLDLEVMTGNWLVTAVDPGAAGLMAHWRLDESSGTTARDSSGNGNDGTLNGGLEWVDGKIDGALQFDGSSGYVQIPHSDSLKVLNQGDFTLAMWFRQDVVTLANLLQQTDRNGTGRTWLFVESSGEIRAFLGGAATLSRVMVEAGTWYHTAVVVTEAGASDTVQLYVNGDAAGTPGQLGMEDCEGDYLISSDKILTGRWWNGLIDDVRIYNRVLTKGERLYLAGLRADLHEDQKIDFKDYAILADQWLDEQLWP